MRKSYRDQIYFEIKKSRRQKDPARMLFYVQALDYKASVSWERFCNSWAYDLWMHQNQDAIDKFAAEQKWA